MITLEIKVNGEIVEVIKAVSITTLEYASGNDLNSVMNKYKVNGVFEIEHFPQDGHRELARKMLNAVRGFKK